MPKMVITHGVADVKTWLGFNEERAAAIAGLGGSDVVGHVAHDGSNMVAVSANVADVDEMMAALASPPPEIAAAMEKTECYLPWSPTSRGSPALDCGPRGA